jgi:hypothetical protein
VTDGNEIEEPSSSSQSGTPNFATSAEGNQAAEPATPQPPPRPPSVASGHLQPARRHANRRFPRSYTAALVTFFGLLLTWLVYLRLHPAPPLPIDSLPPVAQGPQTAVTLFLANDAEGALTRQPATIALPAVLNLRARALLNALFRVYAQPGALHPIAPNPGVEGVILRPLPKAPAGYPHGDLAIVNLSPGLTAVHPSGIEPETLTLLSMLATLHANMPQVSEVRFLVAGHPRPTLAGHADLTRTYLAASAGPAPDAPAPTPAGAHP